MKTYQRIFGYVPEGKSDGIVSLCLSISSVLMTAYGYFLVCRILERLAIAGDASGALQLATKTVVLLTAGGIAYYLSGLFSHKLGFRLETNLRKKGIDGILKAGFRFFDLHQSGVVRKIVDDNAAQTHSAVAHMIPDTGQAILTPILALAIGFLIDIRLGAVLLGVVALGGLLLKAMAGGESTFMQVYQDALKKLSGETVEYIRGIQVVKIFKADVRSFRALYDAIRDYAHYAYQYALRCKRPYVLYQWLFYGIVALLILLLSFVMGRIGDPKALAAELMMLLFLSGIVFVAFMRIMYAGMYLFQANYALDNLESLYRDMLKSRPAFGEEAQVTAYDIDVCGVDFSYGDHEVFRNFSVSLPAGRTYALVGNSGSGKSTLAKLLSGFYAVDVGRIAIGKKPTEAYTEEALSKAIAFVFQDPKLFQSSIYENVALADRDATQSEVMEALRLAGCDEILEKFPLREETVIGTKGVHLSGGERQRIAIARAILKDAPIVIMDEASAAIDVDNEYALKQAFQNLMKNKTVIMIAHRLSSIQNVDEILVLEKGRIVERGDHRTLMRAKGRYKQLVELYHSAEEWRLNDAKVV